MRTPKHWAQRGLCSTLLAPLAALYGIGARLDRRFTTPQRAPLPVISIGNATAGGAGKTPTAIALAALLAQLGYAPHLITRGYGSHGTGVRRALPQGDWRDVGDEALLLAEAAPTWVSADRIEAARSAHAAGAGLVIADDALQHHKLAKDLSLLVIDGAFGIGNGHLLPAGPLREPFTAAMARSDAIILIGENTHQLVFDKPVFRATLEPQGDLSWLAGQAFLAFAGMGRPAKFYRILEQLGARLVETVDFPDHHPYREDELAALCTRAQALQATPITTAKDAVKFPASYRDKIRTLPVALRFSDQPALEKWLQSVLPAPI